MHAKAAARVLALLTRSLVVRLLVLAFATGTAWAQIDLATACNDRAWPGTHDCTPVSPITPWTYQGIIELWLSGDPTYEVSAEAAADRQLQFIAATRSLCSAPVKNFVSGPSPTTVGFPEAASVYFWTVSWSEPTFAPGENFPSCKQPSMQDSMIRVVRFRQIACPPGFRNSQLDSNNVWTCSRPASLCDRDGHVRDCWANPVISLGGTKVHTEVDFEGGSVSPLRLVRHYRSASMQLGGDVPGGVFGQYWTHNYESRLVLNGQIGAPHFVSVYRMGRQMRFRFDGTVYLSQSGVADRLSRTLEGDWLLTLSTGQVERFSPQGRLVDVRDRGKVIAQLTYAANGRLSMVSDPFGRALQFTYDALTGQLQSVTTPVGTTITYTLRRQDPRVLSSPEGLEAAGSGLLRQTNIERVTWQDGVSRRYHYAEAGLVDLPEISFALLTGVTDETATRTSSYRYTGSFTTVTTALAGDVNRYIVYPGSNSTVYGPLGSVTTIQRELAPGGFRVHSQTECTPDKSLCRSESFGYDANGNISERIDPRGTTHGFAYDPVRNLEVRRTEGQGTPAARTILTTWHPTWPIPTEVREFSGGVNVAGVPTGALLKRTVFTYDSSGNLTRRDEIDTVSTPTTRTWQWTYTTSGRVL
ncbi:MAG: DUF6531 domain-containing protein, partial [Burkholderiales bacterium]|nr:DUF6531 domain-containing protein [Burkholderiales bacterium]